MARRAVILVPVLLLVLVGLFFLLRPDPPDSGASAGTRSETFEIEIRDGAMVPDSITVSEGDRVNLRMTSDSPTEFHLHGYDFEEAVEPGEEAELSFDAEISGRFEIEDHHTESVLGELLVQPR
jgi:heme/copper-type cytochrome/quinol oxidase subunit 2